MGHGEFGCTWDKHRPHSRFISNQGTNSHLPADGIDPHVRNSLSEGGELGFSGLTEPAGRSQRGPHPEHMAMVAEGSPVLSPLPSPAASLAPSPGFPPQLSSCTTAELFHTPSPPRLWGSTALWDFAAVCKLLPLPQRPPLPPLCSSSAKPSCLPQAKQKTAQPSQRERRENELLSPQNNHLSSSDP